MYDGEDAGVVHVEERRDLSSGGGKTKKREKTTD